MTPEQLLKSGRPHEALDALKVEVRGHPADAKRRIFLAQLFALTGDLDRATAQIEVVRELDPSALPLVMTYRALLIAEAERHRVFAGETIPSVIGDPKPWMALLFEALRLSTADQHSAAASLRAEALEKAPATSGAINGQNFSWLADGDTRFGPMLEAVLNGRYGWVPFDRLTGISIQPPTDLADLMWLPASFRFVNGGETPGFVPTRYPGSERAKDGGVLLARRTEWRTPDNVDAVYLGLGQRVLMTDDGEFALLDIRDVRLNSTANQGDGDPNGG